MLGFVNIPAQAVDGSVLRNGKHVLVAYIMKPKAGYDYLATAAHFAAESSTGTNVNVCTTDDFTKSVDALVYYIDPDSEEMSCQRSTSKLVAAGPTLDTGQSAAKLLVKGIFLSPGGADRVGSWFCLCLARYDASADFYPMRGRRIGEASHPGPSGGGARATARRREEGHSEGGDGLLDALRPMILELIQQAFAELLQGDALKGMIASALVGGRGPRAPETEGGKGKGGTVNRWQAGKTAKQDAMNAPPAAPSTDPKRASKGKNQPEAPSNGKGSGASTKGAFTGPPATAEVWTGQGRFVSLWEDKGKGKGKSKGKGKQDTATKGGDGKGAKPTSGEKSTATTARVCDIAASNFREFPFVNLAGFKARLELGNGAPCWVGVHSSVDARAVGDLAALHELKCVGFMYLPGRRRGRHRLR